MSNKVLFFVQLPPPVHGVSVTNEKIVKSETLITSDIDMDVLPLRFSAKIEDIDSLNISKIIKTFTIAFRLAFRCIFSRPRIVYFTLSIIGNTFYRDVLYVAILKLLRINIVYHLHRVGVEQAGKDSNLRDFLYRWVFRNTQVIHLTPRLYEDVSPYVEKERCYFVSNGIDDPAGDSRTSRESSDEAVHFVFLSHMVAEKGVIVLLDALAELKKRGIRYRATFAGGRMSEECKAAFDSYRASDKIDDSVRYVGPVYGDDKDVLFAEADVFIFPSLYDSFGIVLVEAMAYSLPVVSTWQGGIPDVVDDGETGFLVEKNDSIALADKMELLAADENLRTEMGRKGRKKFEKQYTSERFEQNILQTLKLCMENSRC